MNKITSKPPAAKRKNLMQSFLSEPVLYGGEITTRHAVYQDIEPRFGKERAGYYAYMCLKAYKAVAK